MNSTWRSGYGDFGFGTRLMPAVKWLLVANFVFFCLQLVFALLKMPGFEGMLALSTDGLGRGFLWQPVSYMFLHGDPLHLLLNCLMLYIFGNEVEAEIGSSRFCWIYGLGGVAGAALWYAFNFHQPALLMGSSGAVYSVTLAFAALFPARAITVLLFFVLPVTLLARHWALVAVGISLIFSLSSPSCGVGHLAHLGGMAVGWIGIRLMNGGWRLPRLRWPWRKGSPGAAGPLSRIQVMPTPYAQQHFMTEKIDPILDKIAERGIQSLSKEERRALEEAKDRLP
ncbi:MAG: rhomboid family intramembrane serine protease [Verrucomicrobiae bacterium]|nr:rhomboid family intramembrane serine protease [Verrucomicrobiae bacterium]